MAVRYQKARVLIAGSVAAAVVAGTAYFAQPQPASTAAATDAGVSQTARPATQNTASTPKTTTIKAKKTRGS